MLYFTREIKDVPFAKFDSIDSCWIAECLYVLRWLVLGFLLSVKIEGSQLCFMAGLSLWQFMH